MDGNINAMTYVRDTAGDKPIDHMEIDGLNVMTDGDRALLQAVNDRLERSEMVVVKEITGQDVKSP